MNEEHLLSSRVCTALMRIGTRMATGFDQHFAELGLTQSQFRILLAVYEHGGSQGLAPSTLADLLLIERGTISVLTSRLVERGWLARQPGKNRRTFQLVLSEEGMSLLQKAIPRAVALADNTLSCIPLDQLRHLQEHLDEIENTLRANPPLEE
jgi:DNA-binding MarR family transcriptional regulator